MGEALADLQGDVGGAWLALAFCRSLGASITSCMVFGVGISFGTGCPRHIGGGCS